MVIDCGLNINININTIHNLENKTRSYLSSLAIMVGMRSNLLELKRMAISAHSTSKFNQYDWLNEDELQQFYKEQKPKRECSNKNKYAKSRLGSKVQSSPKGAVKTKDVLVDKPMKLLRALLDVCYIKLGRLPSMKNCFDFAEKYFLLNIADKMEDYYKYQSATCFALVSQQTEMPPQPSWFNVQEPIGYIMGGFLGRLLRKMIWKGKSKLDTTSFSSRWQGGLNLDAIAENERREHAISFTYSLMDCKRACLAVSSKKQKKAMEDHAKAMTGAVYLGTACEPLENPILVKIGEKVRSLCYSMIGNYQPKKWVPPSSSSHFDGTRAQGGAHRFFRDLFSITALSTPILLGMASYKYKLSFVYGHYHPYKGMIIEIGKESGDGPVCAKVHKVLEPFKVCVITCGEFGDY